MVKIIYFGIIALILLIPSVLGTTWSAYVLDNSSVAINLANVTAINDNNSVYLNSTLTNASGFFNISIPDATSVRLVTTKAGYQNDTSIALPDVTGDFVLPFNITLTQNLPGNITGIVRDNGNFVANANVSAIQGGTVIDSDITDASGYYIITNLRDGTYNIKITIPSGLIQYITNVVVLPGSVTGINVSITTDISAPVISNIAGSVSSTGAAITWTTNEAANSTVYYGLNAAANLISSSSTLTTSHSVILTSLSSSTLYYYNVSSCDAFRNCNTSAQYNFTTLLIQGTLDEIPAYIYRGGCFFRWECGSWSSCINGKQTRACKNTGTCLPRDKLEERVCESIAPEGLPGQLYDISLNMDDAFIVSADELSAVVTFESFGTEPTPVDLTFIILDDAGNEVYRAKDHIVVITEEVLRKDFSGLNLLKGKYTLVLYTLYNVDVFDEFRADFEVSEKKLSPYLHRLLTAAGLLMVVLLFFIYFYYYKKRR